MKFILTVIAVLLFLLAVSVMEASECERIGGEWSAQGGCIAGGGK